jgi:hypothetical protein
VIRRPWQPARKEVEVREQTGSLETLKRSVHSLGGHCTENQLEVIGSARAAAVSAD